MMQTSTRAPSHIHSMHSSCAHTITHFFSSVAMKAWAGGSAVAILPGEAISCHICRQYSHSLELMAANKNRNNYVRTLSNYASCYALFHKMRVNTMDVNVQESKAVSTCILLSNKAMNATLNIANGEYASTSQCCITFVPYAISLTGTGETISFSAR